MTSRRVVIALGGNAMTGPDGSATPVAQRDAIRVAAGHVAEVVAAGVEVVLTHGNGPQVGNLLVKNELAADVVPPGQYRRGKSQCASTWNTSLLSIMSTSSAR